MEFAIMAVQYFPPHFTQYFMYVAALPWEVKSSNLLQIWSDMQTKCIDFYMHPF